MKEHLDYEPIAFTYPFGAISNASVNILKEAGFKALLTCEGKVNKIKKDQKCLYHLCRIKRSCRPDSTTFFERTVKKAIKK